MSNKMPERIFAYEETFNGQNRKTGWVQGVPTPGICNPVEYIRADLVAAKDAEIEGLKARNEFLEKVAEQAISLANIRLEYRTAHDDPEGDDHPYVCCDSCGTPFLSTLAAYLKEKENANP